MEIVIPAWPIIAKIYDFVLDNTQTNNAHTNINKYNVISLIILKYMLLSNNEMNIAPVPHPLIEI